MPTGEEVSDTLYDSRADRANDLKQAEVVGSTPTLSISLCEGTTALN